MHIQRKETPRGYFTWALYQEMERDPDIWFITGDLGFGAFDELFRDFPERCINAGAAETAMMNIAVGLALSGKKPFVYSIMSFLLYRPFEVIRNYINHESINVRLVGNGCDTDYAEDGFSHHSEDARYVLNLFGNIEKYWPQTKERVPQIVEEMVHSEIPTFIGLHR